MGTSTTASPASPVGLTELQALVKFGVDAGNTFGKAFAGGSFDLTTLPSLLSLLSEGKDVLGNMSDLKAALMTLSAADQSTLQTYVIANLNMPEAGAQMAIEKALTTMCKLHELYLLWK